MNKQKPKPQKPTLKKKPSAKSLKVDKNFHTEMLRVLSFKPAEAK